MGLSTCFGIDAWYRDAAHCAHDQRTARARLRRGRARIARSLGGLAVCVLASAIQADTYRVATWTVELSREGPGLLLRDLLRGEDPQIKAIVSILNDTRPDVLLLQGFDYDVTGEALQAFAELTGYNHVFAGPPNSGRQVGLDVDNDGRLGEPEDALGFGRFFGEGGMVFLSRYPIDVAGIRDFSQILWRNVPQTLLPAPNDRWPSEAVHAVIPLSSVAHWSISVQLPEAELTVLAFHAAPPVFDGPEDRNGRRNHDQILFWQDVLNAEYGAPPASPFVLLGNANLDPVDGDGRKRAIIQVLADERLQDPSPLGAEGTDTVDWEGIGVGKLRVSYILPDADITVVQSGVHWPETGAVDEALVQAASRHRLVWVDMRLD